MTTGEKLAVLRKKKNLTQEQLAEILGVSRQSVSRWEMDVAFPETEKLIKIGKILDCSIDYLLKADNQEADKVEGQVSAKECCKFIRECGYFFLATSFEERPRLRPMGMIYANEKALFIATDRRKSVYKDLRNNSQVELASYNLNSRRWIRIHGVMQEEASIRIREEMVELYPMIKQEYSGENEVFFAIFRLDMEEVSLR